jgi:segregation and condensation protein B
VKKLADLAGVGAKDAESGLAELELRLEDTSLMLQNVGNEVQLVTRPEYAEVVGQVVRDEVIGELTRPQLEALTILAYRGPLTRPELEQIRGVHSALILRNLMLRGLVEETVERRLGQPSYAVTFDFVRHLGMKSLEELPEYEELRSHENVVDVLKDLESGEEDEFEEDDEEEDEDDEGKV